MIEIYKHRFTPRNIERLEANQIFVFGSNLKGIHGAGAALKAKTLFGAILGNGEGMMGQSYAIPTKFNPYQTMPLHFIKRYIDVFIDFVNNEETRHLQFLVTRIGCGFAGYNEMQIAPLFINALNFENVCFPEEFFTVFVNLAFR
jgi:hypothetical protein